MLNVISLVGRLTRDPESRQTANGDTVGGFTIAVDDSRSKGPNGEKQTLFMDCSVFGKQADTLIKFWRKGNLIAVYGRLTSRKYVNKSNVEVTAYSVICDRIEFVESTAQMNATAGGEGAPKPAPAAPVAQSGNLGSVDVEESDLPF